MILIVDLTTAFYLLSMQQTTNENLWLLISQLRMSYREILIFVTTSNAFQWSILLFPHSHRMHPVIWQAGNNKLK